MRFAFTPPCWRLPGTTASNRGRWRWRAATRRVSVERSIRYVRENFFAARTYRDLDDLNAPSARLVRRASRRAALPGAAHRLGAGGVARRAAPTARLAREPVPERTAPRGADPQDALCALRPQRLQRAAHLRAAQPHRVGRCSHGSHPRRPRPGRHPRALLRRRRPDRDRRAPRGADRAQARRPWPPRHGPAALRRPERQAALPARRLRAARTWAA